MMGKWGWGDAVSEGAGEAERGWGPAGGIQRPLGTTFRSLGWAGPVIEEFRRGAHLGMEELGFGPSVL